MVLVEGLFFSVFHEKREIKTVIFMSDKEEHI
jgi:hypothetical protein